ncbi:MAG: hypothetical protein HP494_09670 [Nitrospira sp.]|nr:hypothetical protein [Nitrospira sp.]
MSNIRKPMCAVGCGRSPILIGCGQNCSGQGWDSKAIEAVAFAVLAYQAAMEQCGNVPSVTGAAHPALLGCIIPSGPGWFARLRSPRRRK